MINFILEPYGVSRFTFGLVKKDIKGNKVLSFFLTHDGGHGTKTFLVDVPLFRVPLRACRVPKNAQQKAGIVLR